MGTLKDFRAFPLPVRVLLVNQFSIDLGLYLLIPVIAAHLSENLGMSAAVVGMVLAVRNISSQCLFIIGGTAADRFGAHRVIPVGCLLRTVGFALFVFGADLSTVIAAAALSGLSAALFYPAVRAYLAVAAADRKTEAFGLLNMASTTGGLIGLVLGGLLFLVDFRWCALTAAVLFGVLAVVQLITLPAQQVVPSRTGLLSDWREVMTDARFLAFAATMAGMSAMENQLFLLMPAAARRAWGWDGASFFPPALGTLATVLCQLHVTRFARGRAGNGRWIAAGLALMGLGFLLPAFLADATPPLASEVALPAVLGITAAVLVLYCGIMLAQPFAMELVPSFGPERLTGTYFGVYYIFSGLAAAGGNALVGWAMDVGGRTGQSWLPWVSCAAFGLVSAAGVGLLHRRDALPVATHGAVPKPRGPDQLQRDHKEAR